MPDFSLIQQSPEVRAIVQDNLLERAFHDALYPRLLFRGEAFPTEFPGNVGDKLVFTGSGLMKKKMRPLQPAADPTPSTYGAEQWEATALPYGDSIDTHMPTSMVAIANLFLRNGHQLGLGAGQSLNGLARNKLFNAAESGYTVADGAATSTTSLRVKRINGFTRARRPDLVAGSPVKFDTVTGNNPLKIKLFDNSVETANTVVGFTADNAGDEIGPGVLTLGVAVTSVADRAYVIALDATPLVRTGGGNKVDDIGSGDKILLADVRTLVAKFWSNNVPEHEDGRFHAHMDPTTLTQIFADAEFQRLLTALPDHYTYRQFALGELLGTAFFRNSENPVATTVDGGDTATFSLDDNFAPELYSNGNATTGVPIHRLLFTGQEGLTEYYNDMSALITEAGVNGKVGEFAISNSGIEVMVDRVRVIIRAPQDRLQQQVSTSWHFIGDWTVRTDAAVGTAARFKRVGIVMHGE